MDLKVTQKILLTEFWASLAIGFLMVFLYEMEVVEPTNLAHDSNLVFFLQVVMEVVTIAVIPVALKLFTMKSIRQRLVMDKGGSLLTWGLVRLNMLALPMLVNAFLYYQVMSPAFGYMAIILFLCLFFIYPSMGRCYDETTDENAAKK